MANVIWKYDLNPNEGDQMSCFLEMPAQAKILTVQIQHGKPRLWALVDPNRSKELRRFQVVGTGHPFEPAPTAHHIGSFQMHEGTFIFHVFEVL